jgi:hypothetical protein
VAIGSGTAPEAVDVSQVAASGGESCAVLTRGSAAALSNARAAHENHRRERRRGESGDSARGAESGRFCALSLNPPGKPVDQVSVARRCRGFLAAPAGVGSGPPTLRRRAAVRGCAAVSAGCRARSAQPFSPFGGASSMTTLNTTTTQTNGYTSTQSVGSVLPFDSICTPGAYICNWSGHLLRVSEESITAGKNPAINIIGFEPLTVTKISENPYVALTKAKILAANLDINVNF